LGQRYVVDSHNSALNYIYTKCSIVTIDTVELACATSNIKSNTRSLLDIVSFISPRVTIYSKSRAGCTLTKDLDPFLKLIRIQIKP